MLFNATIPVIMGCQLLYRKLTEMLILYCDSTIDLPTCKVIGDSPLSVCYVSYPIVAVHVGYAEQVQTVNTDPYVFDVSAFLKCPETHSDVCTLVCRCTELLLFQSTVWWSERQSVGKSQS